MENQFKSQALSAMCACPGEVLTYTCTVDGGNVTIWGGSALNDCAGHQIILDHRQFNNPGASGECNDGYILGKSVDINGTCYTSQLNVTVSNRLNNTNVTCSSDLLVHMPLGESLITVAGKYSQVRLLMGLTDSSSNYVL